MSKKIALMLSGGTESVAALCYALKQGHDVKCYHSVFCSRSAIESEYAEKICTTLGVEYISSQYDPAPTPLQIRDTWVWLGPAFIIGAGTEVDEVWYGVHKDDDIDQMNDIDDIWRRTVGISRPGCKTISKAPLHHLSKQQQWDMIDVDIKPLVVYCQRTVHEPCGECGKCKEWKKFVKDAEPKAK